MRHLTVMVTLPALLLMGAHAMADSDAAGPGITETFTCEFTEGKNADDLFAAADFWAKQVAKINSKEMDAYFGAVLLPFRATVPTAGYDDWAWIGNWPSLDAMGKGLTDYLNSKEGQAADARWDEMSDCRSNLWLRTPLVSNYPEEDATPNADAVELYFCTLREGTDMAAVEAAEAGFVKANGSAPIATERWTPFLANTPLDLVYLVAHEDLASFTSFNSKWQFSETGQANLAQFNEIMNCEAGIFTGRVIQQGEG